MTITFDREHGLRRSKNESCSKWGNEFVDQHPNAVGPLEIPKFHHLGFRFYFFYYFSPIYLDCSLLFHIFILSRKF